MSRTEMAALRQDEQRAAAAVVGVSDVRFLGHPRRPGRGDPRAPARHQPGHPPGAARAGDDPVARAEPGVHLRQPPRPSGHRRGRARAVYPDARNPFAHPELLDVERLEPWTVPELWIMGPGGQQAGVAVDTTATVERKVAALLCHKSQMTDPDGIGPAGARLGAGNAAAGRASRRAAPPSCTGSPASPERDVGTGDPWVVLQHVAFEGPGASAWRSPPPAPPSPSSASTSASPSRRRPTSATVAGLVAMGGPMGVHDDLEWLDRRARPAARGGRSRVAGPRRVPRRPAAGRRARAGR